MSPSVMREEDLPLYQAAKSHLGYDADMAIRDWGAPRLQTTWTKQAVIEALRASRGKPPRAAVQLAAVNLFGSMIAAREAAKVPILRTVWTDQRVIVEIRALDGERPSRTLVSIAQRRFGSWRTALEAGGGVAQTRRWDAASITRALQARIDKQRPHEGTTVRREDPSLFFAVEHRFGNFDRLVRRFVGSGRLPERGQRRRA